MVSPQWYPDVRCETRMDGFFNGWASTFCGRPKGHTYEHHPVALALDRCASTARENRCDRTAGHDGSHLHETDNGMYGWENTDAMGQSR